MRYYCVLFLLFVVHQGLTQETERKPFDLEAGYFYGTILEHNPDIAHLITDHPHGFMLAYNRKTYGFNDWERRYNYPDVGVTFAYQDMKNFYLGENYSLYAHYNFYFWKRQLQLRIGQGFAVATKPYDRETNFINNAYGTRILSSTLLKFNYKKDNIYAGIGLQAGITLIHYSNANLKAPNNSTNTFALNLGVHYNPFYEDFPDYIPEGERTAFTEPIKYNLAFRSGVNESDINGSGRFPFYTFSAYADKRINHKSALQVGVDVFFARFLKELIRYESIAFPGEGVTGDEDWRRVGVVIGHELFISKMSFITQLGYHVYYDFDFEGRLYNRIGLKRYFGDTLFAAMTVKSHGAKAEAVEFALGVRL
ncbi:acyloxyacyl hydrolase [Croceiramulus getboli]|nr:acyloxyacyl hydrolase [Flavobacteriaceae bacterium YJPT1-3]